MATHQYLGNPADGARTRIIQDLWGLKQKDLARELGHRDQGRLVRYWQSKADPKSPGQDSLEAIEARFGFAPIFFLARREAPVGVPLFHKLSDATSAATRRARGVLQLVGEVADAVGEELTPVSLPSVEGFSAVEAATITRESFGLGSRPVSNLVRLMEQHGIVVAFAPLDVRSLYSYGDRVLGRPVVLSNARTGDRYESRFWLAHELGHLLLHPRGSRYRERGQKVLEDEASVFAAEFLTPESEMIAAAQHIRANGAGPWKSGDDVPWNAIADLKEYFGVEMSSILRRLRDSGGITPVEYGLAIVELASRSKNFRRQMLRNTKDKEVPVWVSFREPGRYLRIESPASLPLAMTTIEATQGEGYLAEYLGIPQRFLDAIASLAPVALDLSLGGLY